MRVLMFSWEYPPRTVGGLAQHVADLTSRLSARGVDVVLVTCGEHDIREFEVVDGVKVHRVRAYHLSAPDFRTWVLQLNLAMLEHVMSGLDERGFDLVHAHDWLVAYVARACKHAWKIPLVATIHATESGRNQGLHNDDQRYISNVEWWLTYEAWRVFCCSWFMHRELTGFFQLPQDKVCVIPNGVDPARFEVNVDTAFRNQYAHHTEKIVFFVGRLVNEKGVQVLLESAPRILGRVPNVKFVISGRGPAEEQLRRRAEELGIANRVYFTGFIDDNTRNRLYRVADAAVFPSLYEPFGIVALEAMAARTPVVVSDTGGLSEIVQDGVDGLKAVPGNADSLADKICSLFLDPGLAGRIRENAFRKVTSEYNWENIADRTIAVYEEVSGEYLKSSWRQPAWLDRLETLVPGQLRQLRYRFNQQNADRGGVN
jgi:glycogen(starch) synthase